MSSELIKERLIESPITIGIMGPIGAGKSTLSKLLGEKLGIPVIEERFTQNPYLEKFYATPVEWSYLSQMWFLTEKIKQLKEIDFTKSQIIDPALEMDLIYAQTLNRINFMEDKEFSLYKNAFDEIYGNLLQEKRIKKPDFYLVVNARQDILEERIKERARPPELNMLKKYPSYLANLKRGVEAFKGNLIYINSSENTFTDEEHMNELVSEIKGYI